MNDHNTRKPWVVAFTIGNTVATVIVLLIILVGFRAPTARSNAAAKATPAASQSSTAAISDQAVAQVAAQVLPKGKPFYGDELGISYDQAEAGITTLAQFDALGSKPIKLTGEKLQRFITIGMSIACEYCCGATTMTKPDGTPACGCAHSQAMRGVAAYLLDKYGDQKSDEEILTEVAKWKALSFPQETVKKALLAKAGSTAGTNAQTGVLNSLPQQVGGC